MPWRRAGFTLIEVLVVLVIISIVLGVVTLNVDHRRDDVAEAVRRLGAIVRLASEEAVLRSRELAMQVEPGGYRFLEIGKDGFVPVEGDEVLRPRQLPEGLELTLALEGEPVQLVAAEEADGKEDQRPARIFLLSSGEVTPFELRLHDPYTEVVWVVAGELTGAITVQTAP
ncbi:MAG: type II secretion system protein GspH [Deltaproteobacteria bacterium CG_4_10_14_3_um_filter_60_8]|nr:MAG: type II secretion system protein GspH [Deltaproteobacteria bacterium CG_4_10_14_3_um_filter_60_8]